MISDKSSEISVVSINVNLPGQGNFTQNSVSDWRKYRLKFWKDKIRELFI